MTRSAEQNATSKPSKDDSHREGSPPLALDNKNLDKIAENDHDAQSGLHQPDQVIKQTPSELALDPSKEASASNPTNSPTSQPPSAATRVSNIPELLQTIFSHVDTTTLRTRAQRVSKTFRNTIRGSIVIQRRLHNIPAWNLCHKGIYHAPIPAWMSTTSRFDSNLTGPVHPGSLLRPNAEHKLQLRFKSRRVLRWLHEPFHFGNKSFRRMQICIPPVVRVEMLCWSYHEALRVYVSVKRVVENDEGITWGEVVDEMVEAKPYLPQAVLTYRFWDGKKG